MTSKPELQLDPAALKAGQEGVEDFYWPVSRTELAEGSWSILRAICDVVRSLRAAETAQSNQLMLLSAYLIYEVTSLFNAQLIASRAQRDGAVISLPKQPSLYHLAFGGTGPQQSPALAILRRGAARPPTWRRWMRPLRSLAAKDVFRRRPIEFVDMKRDVVCVTSCPLTQHRAVDLSRKPALVPLNEWFYPPSADEIAEANLEGFVCDGRDLMVSAIERVFEQYQASFSPALRQWLIDWLDQGAAWIELYRRRLSRRPDQIPQKLWIGSSGVIWSRLLADAVLQRGGEVTGHDHSWGADYAENSHMAFVEFSYCTRFITFSSEQVELYKRIGHGLSMRGMDPELVACHVAAPPIRKSQGSVTSERPRILFVPAFVPFDRFSVASLMAPPVALDWQCRLDAMLGRWGYQVVRKPHPESAVKFDPAIFMHSQEAAAKRFEDIAHDSEVILFDYPMQTSFGFSLRTDKPVVLVDFGMASWRKDDRESLERRCAIVKANFDNENRAVINEEELIAAIRRAPGLRDSEYGRRILGQSGAP